jgi:hypothetical protein
MDERFEDGLRLIRIDFAGHVTLREADLYKQHGAQPKEVVVDCNRRSCAKFFRLGRFRRTHVKLSCCLWLLVDRPTLCADLDDRYALRVLGVHMSSMNPSFRIAALGDTHGNLSQASVMCRD